MILDYKENLEFALANGVSLDSNSEEARFEGKQRCDKITFKNFPHLCLDDAICENCTFENCHEITIENSEVKNCTFVNIDNINGFCTDFNDSNFSNSCSKGPFLTIDTQGCAYGCTFDNITALGDDGYVIYSVYGKKHDVETISECKFINCVVESEDEEVCHCAYFKPFSSISTITIDNIDYDSCVFENTAE